MIVMLMTGQQYLVKTDKAFINVRIRGDLSSLQWLESPLKYFSSTDRPDRKLCRVQYAALNSRDVMLATGRLPPDAIPGMCTASYIVSHLTVHPVVTTDDGLADYI